MLLMGQHRREQAQGGGDGSGGLDDAGARVALAEATRPPSNSSAQLVLRTGNTVSTEALECDRIYGEVHLTLVLPEPGRVMPRRPTARHRARGHRRHRAGEHCRGHIDVNDEPGESKQEDDVVK